MRALLLTAITASLAVAPGAAQDHDRDQAIADGGNIIDGWMARPDRGTLDNLNFRAEGEAMRVTVGPAVILYREGDLGMDNYTATASFTQLSSLGHAHGYGLIVGGSDLQGEGQRYTYFLVKGDGTYLIKKRNGAETPIVEGWTESEAIHMPNADGVATNELAIRVAGNDVVFLMNGSEVYRATKADVDTRGIVGLRINHNLDIKVEDFHVTQ